MIGPNEDLKAAIIAAIPRNSDDPKFYEKLCIVNEVLVEILLLMQNNYKKDIDELVRERDEARMVADEYKWAVERATSLEADLNNCRKARDAYSEQLDAYRKWESRIQKG